jgi:beta-galactosidase
MPPPPTTRDLPEIKLTEACRLFDALPSPVESDHPLAFEQLDQGYGYVLYRTQIAGPADTTLDIPDLRDFAVVSLDQKRVGTLDCRLHQHALALHVSGASATLDILVENGGRINYGRRMVDGRKGIIGAVTLGGKEPANWQMFKFPFDRVTGIPFSEAGAANLPAPCLRRGTFAVDHPADTFLDLHAWGKGIVFVNGHNLGRYWDIGPQQTLFLPGVWLKKGSNEIVVFEEVKDGVSSLAGLPEPILDELNDEPTSY